MENEMIDRVAKALMKVEFAMPGAGGLRGTLHLASAQARDLARAAVEAMREPPHDLPSEVIVTTAGKVWTGIIDGCLGARPAGGRSWS